jgi:hypothetical protein
LRDFARGHKGADIRPDFATRDMAPVRATSRRVILMCNLYSITTNQAAIIALFRVMNRYVGNLPPMAWCSFCPFAGADRGRVSVCS